MGWQKLSGLRGTQERRRLTVQALDRLAERYKEFAPTLLRVGLAAVFIYHGWIKLLDLSGSVKSFAQLGIPFPTLSLAAVVLLELLGGIGLLLGYWVRYLTPLFVLHMLVAIVTVHWPKGFNVFRGGWEFNLVLILASLSLFLTGPGAWGLERQTRARR
ncbi:MAG: DoxX family protein [Nitrospinota bacterium]